MTTAKITPTLPMEVRMLGYMCIGLLPAFASSGKCTTTTATATNQCSSVLAKDPSMGGAPENCNKGGIPRRATLAGSKWMTKTSMVMSELVARKVSLPALDTSPARKARAGRQMSRAHSMLLPNLSTISCEGRLAASKRDYRKAPPLGGCTYMTEFQTLFHQAVRVDGWCRGDGWVVLWRQPILAEVHITASIAQGTWRIYLWQAPGVCRSKMNSISRRRGKPVSKSCPACWCWI